MEDNEIIRLLWERSEHAILGVSEKYGGLVRQTAETDAVHWSDCPEYFLEASSGEHCGTAGFSCEGAD